MIFGMFRMMFGSIRTSPGGFRMMFGKSQTVFGTSRTSFGSTRTSFGKLRTAFGKFQAPFGGFEKTSFKSREGHGVNSPAIDRGLKDEKAKKSHQGRKVYSTESVSSVPDGTFDINRHFPHDESRGYLLSSANADSDFLPKKIIAFYIYFRLR
jgi:hypothetical protein